MAKSNICGDCQHFSDVGKCRIPSTSKREYCGFFADACPYFTREPEQPAPETKKEMETKTPTKQVCKKCGRELPLEQFHKNRWGYTKVCKECNSRKTSDSVKKVVETRHEKKTAPVQEYTVIPDPGRPIITPEEVEAHKQDAIVGILRTATDQQLAAELTRRGYRGHLTKTLINEE